MVEFNCWQQGHLTRLCASAGAMMTPTVVIELEAGRTDPGRAVTEFATANVMLTGYGHTPVVCNQFKIGDYRM